MIRLSRASSLSLPGRLSAVPRCPSVVWGCGPPASAPPQEHIETAGVDTTNNTSYTMADKSGQESMLDDARARRADATRRDDPSMPRGPAATGRTHCQQHATAKAQTLTMSSAHPPSSVRIASLVRVLPARSLALLLLCRSRRCVGQQVPHHPRSAGWRRHELR